jgi:hypothetical protein
MRKNRFENIMESLGDEEINKMYAEMSKSGEADLVKDDGLTVPQSWCNVFL